MYNIDKASSKSSFSYFRIKKNSTDNMPRLEKSIRMGLLYVARLFNLLPESIVKESQLLKYVNYRASWAQNGDALLLIKTKRQSLRERARAAALDTRCALRQQRWHVCRRFSRVDAAAILLLLQALFSSNFQHVWKTGVALFIIENRMNSPTRVRLSVIEMKNSTKVYICMYM